MTKKDLNIKLSWFSKENWTKFVELGFLPILAFKNPKRYKGTPIHFPELSTEFPGKCKDEEMKDIFWDILSKEISSWKLLHTFDILSHLTRTDNIIILTPYKEDHLRETLGDFLSKLLGMDIKEYEWDRGEGEL